MTSRVEMCQCAEWIQHVQKAQVMLTKVWFFFSCQRNLKKKRIEKTTFFAQSIITEQFICWFVFVFYTHHVSCPYIEHKLILVLWYSVCLALQGR